MNKIQELCDIEGMSLEEMLELATFDSGCPGICMNEGCSFTTECEPDATHNYCEDCGTNSVKSCLVLAEII